MRQMRDLVMAGEYRRCPGSPCSPGGIIFLKGRGLVGRAAESRNARSCNRYDQGFRSGCTIP
ncbi:MAG: hypothetical protein MZV64_60215 [Ignavibacteriales bacterium]|nr:hypothetical protein [Ignavibacteriales bacterium]